MADEYVTIDNSKQSYIPKKLRCGIVAMIQPKVRDTCPAILDCLQGDIQQCLSILPTSVHPLVRRTRIWINFSYCWGIACSPTIYSHSTAHHHESWLLLAKDKPEKALGIEIYDCFQYLRMRDHWNGCGLILHEFCHLIHQQVFGLDDPFIKVLFAQAEKSGKFDKVLRRDWAGKSTGDTDLAYCMVDHKEFFAEISVTYWSRGFDQLDMACSKEMDKCNPPFNFTDPSLCVQSWSKRSDSSGVESENSFGELGLFLRQCLCVERTYPHCNKFYPFTNGQLRQFDQYLHLQIHGIWNDIAAWEDPLDLTHRGCCRLWNPMKSEETSTFTPTRDASKIHVSGLPISDTVEL